MQPTDCSHPIEIVKKKKRNSLRLECRATFFLTINKRNHLLSEEAFVFSLISFAFVFLQASNLSVEKLNIQQQKLYVAITQYGSFCPFFLYAIVAIYILLLPIDSLGGKRKGCFLLKAFQTIVVVSQIDEP